MLNIINTVSERPNVVVEWLALLLLIRNDPESNFDMETGYSEGSVCGFPQSFQGSSGTLP
jgi:hypothetical protein